MTTKMTEKKSMWTKVEPMNLDKNKKYVVKIVNVGNEDDIAVIFYCEDGWFILSGHYDRVDMTDIRAYMELSE